jgi:hypothetical protein
MIAGMLGGPERGSGVLPGATRFLPRQLRMVFDFQDDEQDRTQAEISEVRAQTRERDIADEVISLRVARELMLETGELSEAQFEDLELEDGRLSDGTDVLILFNSPDPFFRDVLALGIPEPLDVSGNDEETVLAAIEDAALDLMAISGNPASAKQRDQAKRALAALRALKELYEGQQEEEVDEPPVVDEGTEPVEEMPETEEEEAE